MKFQDLQLIPPLLKALAREGFSDATEIQSEVIPYCLEGNDILGCAQTGSGKTLAFTLPTLQRLYIRNRENEKIEFQKQQEIEARVGTEIEGKDKPKKKKE